MVVVGFVDGESRAAWSAVRGLLDRDGVRTLAGDLYFERGQRYAAEGRVRAVDEDETTIAGTVSGTHDYEVRI